MYIRCIYIYIYTFVHSTGSIMAMRAMSTGSRTSKQTTRGNRTGMMVNVRGCSLERVLFSKPSGSNPME